MKTLRLIFLVLTGIIFSPLIMIVGLLWLIWCIRAALITKQTVRDGLRAWWYYIKMGLDMNKDYIENGLRA